MWRKETLSGLITPCIGIGLQRRPGWSSCLCNICLNQCFPVVQVHCLQGMSHCFEAIIIICIKQLHCIELSRWNFQLLASFAIQSIPYMCYHYLIMLWVAAALELVSRIWACQIDVVKPHCRKYRKYWQYRSWLTCECTLVYWVYMCTITLTLFTFTIDNLTVKVHQACPSFPSYHSLILSLLCSSSSYFPSLFLSLNRMVVCHKGRRGGLGPVWLSGSTGQQSRGRNCCLFLG